MYFQYEAKMTNGNNDIDIRRLKVPSGIERSLSKSQTQDSDAKYPCSCFFAHHAE